MSNKSLKNKQAENEEMKTAEIVKTKAKENKKVKDKKRVKETKKARKGGLGKKLKETGSELKKVNWPSFAKVVKHTGVVITVVLIFTVILLGIDYLLSTLFSLLS